ncbi:hypothetical protein J6590_101469, partial [Homalodisca vitripennis]
SPSSKTRYLYNVIRRVQVSPAPRRQSLLDIAFIVALYICWAVHSDIRFYYSTESF